MGAEPAEIEKEIELARAQLDEDLDLLEERISPPKVAQRVTEGLGRRVSAAAGNVRTKAEAVAQKAKDAAGHATAPVRHQLDAHPEVTEAARKTRGHAGAAASAVRTRVSRHPRASGATGGGAVLVTAIVVVLTRRRRHAPADT